ncbi:MAG: hypothetical protein ACRDEA_19370, partial [Microcystaceae cyanobacterium]
MLPPVGLHLQTRLCAACYAENPVHQRAWQQDESDRCDRHYLKLLSNCPVCQTGFRTPALWESDRCECCGMSFGKMQNYQQSTSKSKPPLRANVFE